MTSRDLPGKTITGIRGICRDDKDGLDYSYVPVTLFFSDGTFVAFATIPNGILFTYEPLIQVYFDMIGASKAGYTDDPATIWKQFGLFPFSATANTLSDCWLLECTRENVAEVKLPSFIRVIDGQTR